MAEQLAEDTYYKFEKKSSAGTLELADAYSAIGKRLLLHGRLEGDWTAVGDENPFGYEQNCRV